MARRRRKTDTEETPLDRWLISYADFITLLFAFFVVMYAISTVNEGKYKVLSETLGAVFTAAGGNSMPVAGDHPASPPAGDPLPIPGIPVAEPMVSLPMAQSGGDGGVPLDDMVSRLQASLAGYAADGLVEVSREGDQVVVQMLSQMLFDSGDAQLSEQARRALDTVGQVLLGNPYPIRVEGHTDNRPIHTAQYPSNWELSSARAASVVNYFSGLGIAPGRMAAVGYGEFRPKADNRTAAGRAKNRRVTLVISSGRDPVASPADAVPWAEGPGLEDG